MSQRRANLKLQINREVTEQGEKIDCTLEVEEQSSLPALDAILSSIFGTPRPERQQPEAEETTEKDDIPLGRPRDPDSPLASLGVVIGDLIPETHSAAQEISEETVELEEEVAASQVLEPGMLYCRHCGKLTRNAGRGLCNSHYAEFVRKPLQAGEQPLYDILTPTQLHKLETKPHLAVPEPEFIEPDDLTVIYYSPKMGRIMNVTEDQIVDLYENHNLGAAFLSRTTDRTVNQIKQLLTDRGIRLRTLAEGRTFHNLHNTSREKTRDIIAEYFGIEVPSTLGMKGVTIPRLDGKANPRKKESQPTLELEEESLSDVENGSEELTELPSLTSYQHDDDLVVTLYILGYSAGAIGRALGCGGNSILRRLRKREVPIRTHKESSSDLREVPDEVVRKFAAVNRE